MSVSPTDVWVYIDERLASLGFDVLGDDKSIEDTIEALEQVTFVRDDRAHMIIEFDQPQDVLPDAEELEDGIAEAIASLGCTATIQSNLTGNTTCAKPVVCVEEIDCTNYVTIHQGLDKAVEYLYDAVVDVLGEERPESVDEFNRIIEGSKYSYMLFELDRDGKGCQIDIEDCE